MEADETCKGCGKQILPENSWMEDGCPCNTPAGVNDGNQLISRWRWEDAQKQRHEVERLQKLCSAQQREIEALNDMADAVERLRDIGRVVGCDHVDGADGRRQLVNCVDQEFERLASERDTAAAQAKRLEAKVSRNDHVAWARYTHQDERPTTIKLCDSNEPGAFPVYRQPEHDTVHPVSQVFFRAGLLACREYMARFVECESPTIAASIRANWWPRLGLDPGPPRLYDFAEIAVGNEVDGWKTNPDMTPTVEALPFALGFLQQQSDHTPEVRHLASFGSGLHDLPDDAYDVGLDDGWNKGFVCGLLSGLCGIGFVGLILWMFGI